jgi:hypothetical protein
MGSTPIERRARSRVSVVLPCYGVANSRLAIGRTVNISRKGVLLAWRTTAAGGAPGPGDFLTFDLALPVGSLGQRYIRCCGRVVRVQFLEGHDPWVALSITQMEFREHSAGIRVRRAGAGDEEPGR